MNPGQKMFNDFFVERALDDRKAEAQELLNECFAKQDAGAFDRNYFAEIKPKFFAIVKPEAVDELTAAMDNFASRL
ncbi:MAG: hypothetical protein LBS19_09880 [Clostridiales bacterium]|jgi:hypothetical protein|nr:hypothetical protein [Clostridiales bacterium]